MKTEACSYKLCSLPSV